jgi:hypothetical protein
MLSKVMEMHVPPTIAKCATAIVVFNLWMSKIGFDTFTFIINFIDNDLVLHHVTIGMFKL